MSILPSEQQLIADIKKLEQATAPDALRRYFQLCRTTNQPIYKLFLGTFLHHKGENSSAIAILTKLFDQHLELFYLWTNNDLTAMTQARSKYALSVVAKTYTDLHLDCMTTENATTRLGNSIWVQTHNQRFSFPSELQKPQLFYIPNLMAQPVWEIDQIKELAPILSAIEAIRAEVTQALTELQSTSRNYLDPTGYYPEIFQPLVGTNNWTAVDLYKEGKPNTRALEKLPVTREIISQLPTYDLDDHPFEVFISTLQAGQIIPPHFGQSNHSLTVHIPIHIPEKCELRVAHKSYQWTNHELLVFDDTFIHQASNGSASTRVVLLLSIWHPDLTPNERSAIKRSFKKRRSFTESQLALEQKTFHHYLN